MVIVCNGDNLRELEFIDIKNLLDTKYGTLFSEKGTNEGYDSYSYPIFSEKKEEQIGRVDIYTSKNEYGYNEYSLHIDYLDHANHLKHDQKRLDDI